MTEPKIYTKNYIDSETVFVPSHGSTNISRLRDMDKDAQYETSGANDDSTQITIEVQFFEAGVSLNRTIDRAIIVNHNLADIEIQSWNGSSWDSEISVSSLAVGTSILSLTSFTTTKVKLLATATQSADQEKLLGLFLLCALQLDVGTELTQLQTKYRQKNSQVLLGDGSLHRTVVMHSPFRSDKYGAKVSFRLLTDAQYESLRAIKEAGEAFLWQPEATQKPEDIFLVHWTSPLNWIYSSSFKGAGKNMSLEVREV